MRKKRFLSILLVIALLFGMAPSSALTAYASGGNDEISATVYKLADSFDSDDGEYLIASVNEAGSGYLLSHDGTTIEAEYVNVNEATETIDAVYIDAADVNESAVWTATENENGYTLENSVGGETYYVEAYGEESTLSVTEDQAYAEGTWTYSDDTLSFDAGEETHYIQYSDGFSSDISSSEIYIFEKTETVIAAAADETVFDDAEEEETAAESFAEEAEAVEEEVAETEAAETQEEVVEETEGTAEEAVEQNEADENEAVIESNEDTEETVAESKAESIKSASVKSNTAAVSAAGDAGTHYLAVASDRHGNSSAIGNAMGGMPSNIEFVCLNGDMVNSGTVPVNDIVDEVRSGAGLSDAEVRILQASHDTGTAAGDILMDDDYSGVIYQPSDYSFVVYAISFNSMLSSSAPGVSEFKEFADSLDPSIPIIAICHAPIHASRTDNKGSEAWNAALNYAATGSENGTEVFRNVVFLHGHNHTNESNREYYIPSGSTIYTYSSSGSCVASAIYYTYTTAGYLNANKTATLIGIDSDNIIISKYSNGSVVENSAYSTSYTPRAMGGGGSISINSFAPEINGDNTSGVHYISRVYSETPEDNTLKSISLDTENAKLDYTVGVDTALDLSGLVVTADYYNGVSQVVTNYTTDAEDAVDLTQAGTYTVTVYYSEDGITQTTTFDITVTEGSSGIPTISLDKSSLSLIVGGDTGSLTATTNNADDATVTWTSSDENVASVSDGTVTAVSAGTAIITASITVDGIEYKATCNVVVTESGILAYEYVEEASAGESYIIVSNGYALVNNAGTLSGTAVTVNGDTVTVTDSTVSESSILWTISNDGDLVNNGYYLLRQSGSGSKTVTAKTTDSGSAYSDWTYTGSELTLTGGSSGTTTYYLYYNSGWYTNTDKGAGVKLYGTVCIHATLTHHEAVAATCSKEGNIEYWTCDKCGKYFSDAAGITEITEDDIVIYKIAHTLVFNDTIGEDGFTWTESSDGYTAAANYKCSVCGDDNAVDAEVTSAAIPATCDKDGQTVYTATITSNNSPDKIEHVGTKTVTAMAPAGGYSTALAAVSNGEYVIAYYDGSQYYVLNSDFSITILSNLSNVTDSMKWTASAASSFSLKNVSTGSYIAFSSGTSNITTSTSAKTNFSYDGSKLVFTPGGGSYSSYPLHFTVKEGAFVAANTKDQTSLPESGYMLLYSYEEGSGSAPADPALGHDWDYDNIVWNWTEADNGYTATATLTCTRDGSHTEVIEATVTGPENYIYTATITGPDGKSYTDTKEVTPEHEHTYGTPVYVWSDDNNSCTATAICSGCDEETEGHTVTETVTAVYAVAAAATCTTEGSGTYTATFENSLFTEQTNTVSIPVISHTLVPTEDKEATCEEDGNIAYWTCSVCSKYFSDATGANEIEENSWVIEKLGHNWKDATYEWSDDNSSVTATRTCANDGDHVETETVATTSEVTKEATCEAKGETTYTATFTNVAFEEQTNAVENIDALGHDWNTPTYEWTADNSSVTAKRVCKRDETHAETETAATTSEVTRVATCEEKGETTYTAAFTNGAFATQTKAVDDIDALGHAWNYVDVTWTAAEGGGYTAAANYKCDNDPSHTATVEATVTSETSDATCTEPGVIVYTAKVTAEVSLDKSAHTDTTTVTGGALGHDWNNPTYEWSADNSSVTAKRVCKRDKTHVETETAAATSKVTKEATCDEKGETTYTATFTNEAFATQTKAVDDIDALGHAWNYVDITWTAAEGGGYTAAANYKCGNNPAHTAAVEATVTSETSDATCTEPGAIVYTAKVTAEDSLDKTAHTDTKTVTGEALGHDYELTGWTWSEDNSTAEARFTCKNDTTHVETVTAEVTSETTAAGCETDGKTVYTATAKFEDKTYTDTKEVTIEATGHNYELTGWIWSEDNSTAEARFTCKNDTTHVETVTAEVTSETTAAGCETDGKTVYTATAEFNSKTYTDTKEVKIEATGHAWGDPSYTWSEDNSKVTAIRICGNNPAHFETETVSTSNATVNATCTENGKIVYTSAEFNNSAFTVQKTEVIIPAIGHEWSYVDITWTAAEGVGYTAAANYKCGNDPAHTAAVEATVTSETSDATCTEPGAIVYTAKVTAEDSLDKTAHTDTKTVTGEALGHDWDNPTYEWSADNSSVTAKRVCKRDETHVETETVNTKSVVTAPTCEAAGFTTYTATFKNEAFAEQTKKVDGEAATGHDWGTPTYKWTADNSKVTATRICANDQTHVETETVNTTSVRTEPTCEEAGSITYTAIFSNEAFKPQTKTITIEASGHNLIHVDAKEATKEEPGNIEYWYCPVCGKYFMDEEGTIEISEADTIIPILVIKPESIALDKHSAEMVTSHKDTGDSTLKLNVSILPEDAEIPKLIWSSSDEEVAVVDQNGVVTALRYGTVVITVRSADDNSLVDSCSITTRFYDVAGSPIKGEPDYQYYYTPVYWAADHNPAITTGYDRIYFGPERDCQRRELMIFLWRLSGCPESDAYGDPRETFNDMGAYGPSTATYKAAAWAIASGITKGYDDGGFHPTDSIARKDTMIMLYRLAGKPNVTGSVTFPDVLKMGLSTKSDTYQSILWGSKLGITSGYADGTFKPMASCLREHIVTFIYRYDSKVN